MNYSEEVLKVLTHVKYRGCLIRRVNDKYYWANVSGTLDEMKKVIDNTFENFGENFNQKKAV